jgi:hypothetical protein
MHYCNKREKGIVVFVVIFPLHIIKVLRGPQNRLNLSFLCKTFFFLSFDDGKLLKAGSLHVPTLEG